MSDYFNQGSGSSSNSTDPGGHKANHDVNQRKLHTEGIPSVWRQITNLLITVAVLALIFGLIRLIS